MNTKICSRCKIEKQLDNFDIKKNSGWCEECHKEYAKEYRKINKEKLKEENVRWRSENKEKIKNDGTTYHQKNKERINKRNRDYQKTNYEPLRNWRLKYTYGMTLDDFKAMSKKQGDVCAVCLKPEIALKNKTDNTIRSLAVDHDHLTGNVRGLLCQRCNKGLGFFDDSEEKLIRATEYLRKSKTL